MNEKQTTAKAGKLLCAGSSEDNDYEVTGFFVVLRDFNPNAELEEYLTANPEQRERYHFEQDSYLASLIAKGLLLEVDYGTLYLGSYSAHEDFSFTPANKD